MTIDYIAPAHLFHSPMLYEREKKRLKEVLDKYPVSALSRIEKPWPFTVSVKCTLSGEHLDADMVFGMAT